MTTLSPVGEDSYSGFVLPYFGYNLLIARSQVQYLLHPVCYPENISLYSVKLLASVPGKNELYAVGLGLIPHP